MEFLLVALRFTEFEEARRSAHTRYLTKGKKWEKLPKYR